MEDDEYEICYLYEIDPHNATQSGIIARSSLYCQEKNIKVIYWTNYCKNKNFTKDNIKPFMLVITRDGERYIATKNLLVDKNRYYNEIADYGDDLKMKNRSSCPSLNTYNIMSIYVPRNERCSLSFSLRDRVCVWERK